MPYALDIASKKPTRSGAINVRLETNFQLGLEIPMAVS